MKVTTCFYTGIRLAEKCYEDMCRMEEELRKALNL
jgi:hypothetical protein